MGTCDFFVVGNFLFDCGNSSHFLLSRFFLMKKKRISSEVGENGRHSPVDPQEGSMGSTGRNDVPPQKKNGT